MSRIVAYFHEDGKTALFPYILSLVEHPKSLERYRVACVKPSTNIVYWEEAFTTATAACERFVEELRVMARDMDGGAP